ncbi:nucleoside kinase [Desulfolucanica intricata]|uniref:nucleoside kinase n=1 Tax=Desulfolucanica intricata TaxID=1285191 RepID=UPI000ADC956C|nr:nucleoside kinase [Desulfolucanica intricata]
MKKINILINGSTYEYDSGVILEDISKDFGNNPIGSVLLGIVNNRLRSLTYKIEEDAEVRFLDLSTTDGQKTYKRSLSFLFIKAVHDVLEEAQVELCHTLSKGQYCIIKNYPNFNEQDVKTIKERMQELVEQNIPFIREELPVEQALTIFKDTNREEKIHLFKNINKEFINIYTLGDYKDYFYGYLVPSTGYLRLFDLVLEDQGVVLLCPKKSNPSELTKHMYQPKLLKVFRETKDWAQIMGVNYVGDLNQIIVDKEYPELIRTVEALHENKIIKIADEIISNPKKGKIVLIAGPSSSGKTSFSRRLAIQLKVNRLKPVTISLDDYFVNREDTPLDENGQYDFESINALDLELFNYHLKKLIEGEEVELPNFNFKTGKREFNGHRLKIGENQPIIIEGIHGLNNLLTSSIAEESKFKIYISPLTQPNLDYHNRISTTDCRLIRRIVRDHQFRGYDAKSTIKRWDSVRKGEEKYIFPFQEEADAIFNSTLIYELAVLKKYVVPLLKAINEDEEGFIEAKRLLKFIMYFRDIKEELDIPPTSILREFIGGSRIV